MSGLSVYNSQTAAPQMADSVSALQSANAGKTTAPGLLPEAKANEVSSFADLMSSTFNIEKPNISIQGVNLSDPQSMISFLNNSVNEVKKISAEASGNIRSRSSQLNRTAQNLSNSLENVKKNAKPSAQAFLGKAIASIATGNPIGIACGVASLVAYADSMLQEKLGRGVVSTVLNIFTDHDTAKNLATDLHSAVVVTADIINTVTSPDFKSKFASADLFSKTLMIGNQAASSFSVATNVNATKNGIVYKLGNTLNKGFTAVSETANNVANMIDNVGNTAETVKKHVNKAHDTITGLMNTLDNLKKIYDNIAEVKSERPAVMA